MTREESPGVVPPSASASSAARTCRASRSGSAYTATLVRPASLHARATRTAISPRLAIRTFCTAALLESIVPDCNRTYQPVRLGAGRRSAPPQVGERQSPLRQLGAQRRQREPDDGRRVALHPADERRPEPVEGEGAGHGERLAGGEVGLQLLGGQR